MRCGDTAHALVQEYSGLPAEGRATESQWEGNQLAYQTDSARDRRGSGVSQRGRRSGAMQPYTVGLRVKGSGTWIRTTTN